MQFSATLLYEIRRKTFTYFLMSVSGNTFGINKWERITPKRELQHSHFHSKCQFTRLYIKGNKSVSSFY